MYNLTDRGASQIGVVPVQDLLLSRNFKVLYYKKNYGIKKDELLIIMLHH